MSETRKGVLGKGAIVTLILPKKKKRASEFFDIPRQQRCESMQRPPNDASRILRKSVYGRTNLFLPSKGTLLRQVKCMGDITRHGNASVYHVLPTLTSGVCCWHCGEPISGEIVPVPRMYDTTDNTFYVYGATCQPECAKAYILEHTSFDRAQQMNTFTRMMRDVYGIEDVIVETPPRCSLKRFGGPFDSKPKTAVCRIAEAPFLSHTMLVEETNRESHSRKWEEEMCEADTFEEESQGALFDAFLESNSQCERVVSKKKDKSTAQPRQSGPMTRFVRQT